jgi:trans-aconitate methyltransferase
MDSSNPIDLLFEGLEKLGPGSNDCTLHVLRFLPKQVFPVIVDAGCGAGRQTMALAKELRTLIHAVDSYSPFLNGLSQRARKAGIGDLIQTHCMDMRDIPLVFQKIDLLWSEGAAYNIGFSNALTTWASAIQPDGLVVVSELSWLLEQIPDAVREFFRSGYPDMHSVPENIVLAEKAGYKVLTTHTIPKEAWVEGYYDVLDPRARALLDHPDSSVREYAVETLREIEIFNCSEDSYGYVFYVLQRAATSL